MYYTANWVDRHLVNFDTHLQHLKGVNNLRFLEIGSYEGKSAIYITESFLTGVNCKIDCIDPFLPTYEYREEFPNYEDRFDNNVRKYAKKIIKHKGFSKDILITLEKESYDFIYIDGSHKAEDIITDARLSYPLLKPGGIMAFDDYELTKGLKREEYPKIAIDKFLNEIDSYELLSKGWQIWIKKPL